MAGLDQKLAETMDGYNQRRWLFWLASFGLLIFGGYRLADVTGVIIAGGGWCLAVAISQEIRAGLFPIGMAAIRKLGRTAP